MKILVPFLLYFFIPNSLYSQILNIEQFRPDRDTSNMWMGTVNLGFSTRKQLNNILSFHTDLNVAYMSRLHTYMFLNHISLVKVSGSKVISEGYFHSRINLFRKQFFSYEPFVQFQYDLGRGMEERKLVGLTIRLDLKSEDRLTLGFNTGLMYESETWVGNVRRYATDNTYSKAQTNFMKSTSNFSLKYRFTPGVSLFSLTYYQARFGLFFSPRIISDTQFQFLINKHLSFSTQYVLTFDDHPIIANTQIIYAINNTLVIRFP